MDSHFVDTVATAAPSKSARRSRATTRLVNIGGFTVVACILLSWIGVTIRDIGDSANNQWLRATGGYQSSLPQSTYDFLDKCAAFDLEIRNAEGPGLSEYDVAQRRTKAMGDFCTTLGNIKTEGCPSEWTRLMATAHESCEENHLRLRRTAVPLVWASVTLFSEQKLAPIEAAAWQVARDWNVHARVEELLADSSAYQKLAAMRLAKSKLEEENIQLAIAAGEKLVSELKPGEQHVLELIAEKPFYWFDIRIDPIGKWNFGTTWVRSVFSPGDAVRVVSVDAVANECVVERVKVEANRWYSGYKFRFQCDQLLKIINARALHGLGVRDSLEQMRAFEAADGPKSYGVWGLPSYRVAGVAYRARTHRQVTVLGVEDGFINPDRWRVLGTKCEIPSHSSKEYGLVTVQKFSADGQKAMLRFSDSDFLSEGFCPNGTLFAVDAVELGTFLGHD